MGGGGIRQIPNEKYSIKCLRSTPTNCQAHQKANKGRSCHSEEETPKGDVIINIVSSQSLVDPRQKHSVRENGGRLLNWKC